MKRVLILGASGMLGHKLVQVLSEQFNVWGTLRGDFCEFEHLRILDRRKVFHKTDVLNFDRVSELISEIKPDALINAVGVIKQLPSSKNVINTLSINSIFPHRLADLAAREGFKFINISTDCVFDGRKGNYKEDDIPDALDLYGKSKNFGEVSGKNCLTLRTSIIGRELETSHSLIEWFLSNRGGRVKGFKGAIYTGFPTVVLAKIIGEILCKFEDLEGLYHVSSDPINKYELLQMVKEEFCLDISIEPDEDFQIDRSLNSDKFRKLTGFQPESWREMVRIMAKDAEPYIIWRKKLLQTNRNTIQVNN